jgi:hypothetical protein
MKFERIKKDSQLTLNGVTFETEYHDSALQGVTMRDAAGNVVRLALNSYSLYALVPAKPTVVKRHRVAGTVAGFPVEQFFENDYDATRAKSHYESKLRSDEDVALTITVVEVPEEQAEPSPDIPF